MAIIYEGMLSVVAVAPDGTPISAPRRLVNEMAHMPSWSADGRHILYQSNEKLRLLDDRGVMSEADFSSARASSARWVLA